MRPVEVAVRAVVPLSLSLLLLAGCSQASTPEARRTPAATPAGTPSAAAPASTPPPTARPTATSTAQAVALYWLGAADHPRGPRLYREFVRLPGEPVRAALDAMLAGAPRDPDYRSLWADGTTVREVRREGTTAVVDLSRQARTNGGGSAFEAATLQQLVHVVTAADPSLRAVRLLVEGEPVDTLWGAVDTSQPLVRAPAAEVLGPVWLDVEEGGTVDGRIGGTATVFEATVSWQVRQGDRVVQEGFSTATEGAPGRGTWEGELDVPPGEYELWAYESSAQDGSITWLDTKRVTVR